MTVYCYDSEFMDDGRTIELISIGVVCEDGREYYAVNSDADWKRIRNDDWLMDNVVRHLPTHATGQVKKRDGFGEKGWLWGGLDMRSPLVKPKWVIANEVREFIVGGIKPMGEHNGAKTYWSEELPELWAYYGAYDHVALAQLWGPMIHLPKLMPMWTHDLMQLIEPLKGFALPEQQGSAHNALDDARWNLEVLRAARQHSLPDVTR